MDIKIEGFQRYPLANHIGWLVDGKPGGQDRHILSEASASSYEQLLKEADETDTLIAFATK